MHPQWYCGAAHQRIDWKLHRRTCVVPTPEQEAVSKASRACTQTLPLLLDCLAPSACSQIHLLHFLIALSQARQLREQQQRNLASLATGQAAGSVHTANNAGGTATGTVVGAGQQAKQEGDDEDDIEEVDSLMSIVCPLSIDRLEVCARVSAVAAALVESASRKQGALVDPAKADLTLVACLPVGCRLHTQALF